MPVKGIKKLPLLYWYAHDITLVKNVQHCKLILMVHPQPVRAFHPIQIRLDFALFSN